MNHNEDSGSHDSDMILFKQFLYRTVQGALNLEESTLLEFGNDGDRDCAFPHRYNLSEGLNHGLYFNGETVLFPVFRKEG